jgi:hypothetical protein
LKPALQRAFTGATIEALFLQKNANQSTTPRGVLLTHLEGFLERVTFRGHRFGGAADIIGFQSVLTTLRKTTY